MNKLQFYFSSVFLCAVLLQMPLSAQVKAYDPPAEPASVGSDAEENLIHLGDLIDVDVVGSTEYDWRGTLSPEGFLSGINFTENPIYALCQTEDAVAAQIIKSYSRILRSPQIVVRILDRSKRPTATVIGAVKKAQRFQIKRPVFLNELVVVSGGFTDKASGSIQIFRQPSANCLSELSKKSDETQYINVEISDLLAGKQNPQIFGGDIVTVGEAKPIYVIGAVGVPKQIAVRGEITLTRALDSAGGILKNADAASVVIFRRNTGASETIEADLNKIKSGQIPDIILQAFDVIDVAETGREKRKFPPILRADESIGKAGQNLPLRVID